MGSLSENPSLVTTALLVAAIVFPILATLAVAFRVWTTLKRIKHLFIDDYVLIAALIFAWGVPIDMYIAAGRGGVNESSKSTLEASSIFLQIFPLIISLVLVKVSILFLYKRIFASASSWFQIAVWIYVAILVSWGIACLMAQVLAGDPVSAAYDPLAVNPLRYNYSILSVTMTGMSMCFDVIVLCFPLPVIHRLMISTTRKLQLVGIFWLGIFCCIASVLRFYHVYKEAYTSTSSTGTKRYVSVTLSVMWGTIEPSASVVAACLPTYGHLFDTNWELSSRIPSFWGRLSSKSNVGEDHSSIRQSVAVLSSASHSYILKKQSSGYHQQWLGFGKSDNDNGDIEMAGTTFENDHVPLVRDL